MHEREERFSTDMAIRVFHGEDGHRAHSVNVSIGGACLIGVGGLPEDAEVTIRYLHLCIRAEVAWSSAEETGVRFTIPLTPSQLQELRGSGPGRAEHRQLL